MARHGVPGLLIWPAIALQIGAGLAVAVGYQTRLSALSLAAFCVVASALFHNNFADLGEVSNFTKDMATAGGFLILALVGAGPLSLDGGHR
jgi:putative oxidoreductase